MNVDYDFLILLNDCYNRTDQKTIKNNIRRMMKTYNIKYGKLSEILNISQHTAYAYTNKANSNKPELFNLLLFATYLNVDVVEFLGWEVEHV